jgi:tRNA modification GTPase
MNEDTIVALASAPGRSGISVIRISGTRATHIGALLCGKLAKAWTIKPCTFVTTSGQEIDSGLVVSFEAPRSYTGEDVVELHCHGSPVIVDMLVEAVVASGARMAEPGEFTKRAFLNNKMDLSQAESVADIISAQTRAAVIGANASLKGVFAQDIESHIKKIISIRVFIEASIDFPEEDIDTKSLKKIHKELESEIVFLNKIIRSSKSGITIREGVKVVILGPPNSGKSTLLNQLSQQEMAIVSNEPGTTRDLVRVTLNLKGVPVELVDTAGLRSSDNEIENKGMDKAIKETRDANLVLLLSDHNQEVVERPKNTEYLIVRNKIDLLKNRPDKEKDTVFISAKTGAGVDLLISEILSRVGFDLETEVPAFSRRRHLHHLEQALLFSERANDMIAKNEELELVAENLLCAQNELGSITSPISSDELLGEIFSEFCIGK